jgi:putative Holliday junction resolvase
VSIVGIDYGGRRIGIAVSESGLLATPHSVIANDGDLDAVVERLSALAAAVDAEVLVLGVPRRAVSHRGEEKFEHLAAALRQKTCKEVVLWDETLSTVEAAAQRRASGKRGRKINADIDMHAAAVILQSWLDHQSGRTS